METRIKEETNEYGTKFFIQRQVWRKSLFWSEGYYEWKYYDVPDFVRLNGVSTMLGRFESLKAAKDFLKSERVVKIKYHTI